MKLKNNDPGKIWAKSDKRFKSYDQKVHFWAKKRYFWNRLGTGPITRFPGTRIFVITRFSLPGSWQAYLEETSEEQDRGRKKPGIFKSDPL